MKTQKGMNPARRLEMGAAILAAARVVDTELVSARLTAFAKAHRSYADADRQVEAAEAQVRQGQVRLTLRDAEQDRTVEALARALVSSGQPRTNPFAAFGIAAPSAVKEMTPAAEAGVIRQLIAAVRRQKPGGKAMLAAAQTAETAAGAVEAAAAALAKLQATLEDSRQTRDSIGATWEATLSALKRGARAAADEGAPDLYAALFGSPRRPARKTRKPPAPVTPGPTPDPAVVA